MKKIVRLFLSRGVSILSAYLFTLIVTNKFNTNDAGLLFLSINILLFLVIIARFGQEQTIIKALSSVKRDKKKISSYRLFSILSISIILSIILYFLFFLIKDIIFINLYESIELKDTATFIIYSLFPVSLIYIISGILKSYDNQGLANFVETGAIPFLMIFILLIFEKDLLFFTKMYFLCSIFITIILFIYIRKHFAISKPKVKLIKEYFKSGEKIMLASIMSYSLITLPALLIMYFQTASDVALFNVALRLSFLVSIVIAIFNSLVAPKFVELYSKKEFYTLEKYYFKNRNIMLIIILIPVLLLFIFAKDLLLLFGADYQLAVNSFRILLIAQFISIITGTTGIFLTMTSNEKKYRDNVFISFIIGMPLSVFLISTYGLNGAAFAIAIAIIFENILSYLSIKKIFKGFKYV